MPSPISGVRTPVRTAPTGRTYTVRPGDTLSTIARRTLGDARRWKELYELNKQAIGANPHGLRVGTILKLSGPAPAPAPAPKPEAPDYGAFVAQRVEELRRSGAEVDCADLAIKLLSDFCAKFKLPNPLAKAGKWHTYTPEAPGGLPNVNGPNYVFAGVGADRLAKGFTRNVGDRDGNGIAGWDRQTGRVDAGDLRPGDILFYDWDGDGKVNHTVNVVGVDADGTVTLAFGTYDNLGSGPVQWKNLDLKPIEKLVLTPGTPDYDRWLGAGNCLWGVRRFSAVS